MVRYLINVLLRVHLNFSYYCPFHSSMDSASSPSRVDDGAAAERQPLLPSPPSMSHPNVYTAIEGAAAENDGIDTLLESRIKLGASALNFFLSGIEMAAIGVGITAHKHTSEAC